MYTTVISLKLDEAAYATDSSNAYEAAESAAVQTGNYPVQYPAPYGVVGCGFGALNQYVVSQIDTVAHDLNIDYDLTNQLELTITLYFPQKARESAFKQAFSDRLIDVYRWIKNAGEVFSA